MCSWWCCFSFLLRFMGRIVPVKRVRSIWRTSSNASQNVRIFYLQFALCFVAHAHQLSELSRTHSLTHTRARARSPVRANVNTNERPRNNNGFVSPHTHTHTHIRNNKVLLHRMFRHSTHTAAPCLFDGGVDFSRVFYTATHTPHTSAHVHTHTRAQGGRGVEYISQCTHRAAYA